MHKEDYGNKSVTRGLLWGQNRTYYMCCSFLFVLVELSRIQACWTV